MVTRLREIGVRGISGEVLKHRLTKLLTPMDMHTTRLGKSGKHLAKSHNSIHSHAVVHVHNLPNHSIKR